MCTSWNTHERKAAKEAEKIPLGSPSVFVVLYERELKNITNIYNDINICTLNGDTRLCTLNRFLALMWHPHTNRVRRMRAHVGASVCLYVCLFRFVSCDEVQIRSKYSVVFIFD